MLFNDKLVFLVGCVCVCRQICCRYLRLTWIHRRGTHIVQQIVVTLKTKNEEEGNKYLENVWIWTDSCHRVFDLNECCGFASEDIKNILVRYHYHLPSFVYVFIFIFLTFKWDTHTRMQTKIRWKIHRKTLKPHQFGIEFNFN